LKGEKMKNLKRLNFLFIFVMLLFLAGGALAYQFEDVNNVLPFYKTAPSSGLWVDYIDDNPNGSNFNTLGANLSGNILTIFTNWNPNKEVLFPGVLTADLFIRDWSKNTTYSIRLDTLNNQNGTLFIINNDLSNLLYSQDLMKLKGYTYAGLYGDAQNIFEIPVWTLWNGFYHDSSVVTWKNGYVDVDLRLLNLGNDWSFFWGTGTCGNDVISGSVHPTVPEPGMLLLLGVGLIGLGGLRRKLKN
jgi:hypothetical protein